MRNRWQLSALVLTLGLMPLVERVQAQARPVIVVRSLVGRGGRVIADTMGKPYEIPAEAGRVFSAVAAVYADLKIPVELRDSAALQIGNEAFVRRGDVAGRRMSAYLECGQGFTGPRADAYRIDLGLVTFVTPAGQDAANLRTVFLGTAVNVSEGASRSTQGCYTTGELERRIHQAVLKKLAP